MQTAMQAARGGRPPLSPAIKSPTKSSKRAPQKGNPEAGGLDAAPAAVAAAGVPLVVAPTPSPAKLLPLPSTSPSACEMVHMPECN